MRMECDYTREELLTMVRDALAAGAWPGLDNDGGPANLAEEIRMLMDSETAAWEEVARLRALAGEGV